MVAPTLLEAEQHTKKDRHHHRKPDQDDAHKVTVRVLPVIPHRSTPEAGTTVAVVGEDASRDVAPVRRSSAAIRSGKRHGHPGARTAIPSPRA